MVPRELPLKFSLKLTVEQTKHILQIGDSRTGPILYNTSYYELRNSQPDMGRYHS